MSISTCVNLPSPNSTSINVLTCTTPSKEMTVAEVIEEKEGSHNAPRSSTIVEVGQVVSFHQPNFANDSNGLSYGG